ncbi:MAG: OmpA family protein [Deltaproteobacteria bacterium]|nr:OmpA family protein [Deltaproteobacteria bacterium]
MIPKTTKTFLAVFLAAAFLLVLSGQGALSGDETRGDPRPGLAIVPAQGTVKEYRIKDGDGAAGPEHGETAPPPIVERDVEKPNGVPAGSPAAESRGGDAADAASPATATATPAPPAGTGTPAAKDSPAKGGTRSQKKDADNGADKAPGTPGSAPASTPTSAPASTPTPTPTSTRAPVPARETGASPDDAGGKPALPGTGIVNPGVELTLENMEKTLVFPEDRDVSYGDSLLTWKGNKLYRKNADGSLTLLDSSLDTLEDEYGQRWLTQDEEGNFLIQVSLKVWAIINFEYNSHKIRPDSEDILRAFGTSLMSPALKDFNLIIAGHTDNVGSRDFNLTLSKDRAASVARWLTEKTGVAPERMILSGHAFDIPIADNATAEGRAKNRRVEFVLLPAG